MAQDKEGSLRVGPRTRTHMRRAIQSSSNYSTNWLIDAVGGPREVQRILDKYAGGIFQDTSIVEKIPGGGRTYKNKSSARDLSRFLYALHHNNIPRSREVLGLMRKRNRDRFYDPPGVGIADKTGTTGKAVGDFGILYAEDSEGVSRPYIVIAMTQRNNKRGNFSTYTSTRSEHNSCSQ